MPVDPVKASHIIFHWATMSAPGYKDVIQPNFIDNKEHNASVQDHFKRESKIQTPFQQNNKSARWRY
jgi:hypothetical protein